jgi:hypothetical protein
MKNIKLKNGIGKMHVLDITAIKRDMEFPYWWQIIFLKNEKSIKLIELNTVKL